MCKQVDAMKPISRLLVLLCLGLLALGSCRKAPDYTPTPEMYAAQVGRDEYAIQTHIDWFLTDLDSLLANIRSLPAGHNPGFPMVSRIDKVNDDEFLLEFAPFFPNEVSRFGFATVWAGARYQRAGRLRVTLPAGAVWTTPGTTVTLRFENVTFQQFRYNPLMTLRGSMSVQNVSGGIVHTMPNNSARTRLISTVGDPFRVTFHTREPQVWQLSKTLIYSRNDNGLFVFNQAGAAGANIATGVLADGTTFSVALNGRTTVTRCGWLLPVEGVKVVTRGGTPVTIEYGRTDAGRAPAANTCGIGFVIRSIPVQGAPRETVYRYLPD